MAWKETCVMNERTILVGEFLTGGYSVSQLARRRGISRKTAIKWIERYEKEGLAGLEDRSRAPHHQPYAIAEAVEQRILELKAQWPLWGAPKIHAKLLGEAEGGGAGPSESTVSNVLQRHGLTRQKRRRARTSATPSPSPLIHCQGPNQVWCADFKGWFRTGDGRRCDPLTITDAYSRYLLCCHGLGTTTGTITVKPLFEATFREYGLPEAIRTDNGAPFASPGLAGLTQLSVWWMKLGIRLERIEPGEPQQNGRHERMHRTLQEATTPARANLRLQQKAFGAFRREFNQERPHEALGQKPPAQFYVPSVRDYPERLVGWDYADDWQKRKISPGGQMRWNSQKVHVSHALVNETIGLKPTEQEGLWLVYFQDLQLGHWDEQTRRLRPCGELRYEAALNCE
jgi:transposase InsO family protein